MKFIIEISETESDPLTWLEACESLYSTLTFLGFTESLHFAVDMMWKCALIYDTIQLIVADETIIVRKIDE